MPTYVRVKDPSTGHEFDVPEGSVLLRKDLVKRVKSDRFPPSPLPRPAKHNLKLAALPESRQTQSTAVAATEPTDKENPDG